MCMCVEVIVVEYYVLLIKLLAFYRDFSIPLLYKFNFQWLCHRAVACVRSSI